MNQLAQKLWNDDAGFIVSIELILIATIAVIGLITGITSVRDAVVSELSDVAGAVQDLNQTYIILGIDGHAADTAGSGFADATDFCDDPNDLPDTPDNCILINVVPVGETGP